MTRYYLDTVTESVVLSMAVNWASQPASRTIQWRGFICFYRWAV